MYGFFSPDVLKGALIRGRGGLSKKYGILTLSPSGEFFLFDVVLVSLYSKGDTIVNALKGGSHCCNKVACELFKGARYFALSFITITQMF